jgi:uncharacterized membrane protein YtjA (UPF0391 family)
MVAEWNRCRGVSVARRKVTQARGRKLEHDMIEWIVILLIVAAIASLLGFRGVAGVSAGIAKVLIFIVLIGLLLMLIFGVLVFA